MSAGRLGVPACVALLSLCAAGCASAGGGSAARASPGTAQPAGAPGAAASDTSPRDASAAPPRDAAAPSARDASAAASAPAAAPLSLTLPDLQGKPRDLTALRGKVVLLDFWATWCEPCKRGLPVTEALARANEARGLVALAVNTDSDASVVPAFVARLGLGLTVLLDNDGTEAQKLGAERLPYTLVLDRRGAVRLREEGSGADSEERIAAAVAKLLDEPAPAAAPRSAGAGVSAGVGVSAGAGAGATAPRDSAPGAPRSPARAP